MKRKINIKTWSKILAALVSIFLVFVIGKYEFMDFRMLPVIFALSILYVFMFFFLILSDVVLYFLSKKSTEPVVFSTGTAFQDKNGFLVTLPIILLIGFIGCIWMNADQAKELDVLKSELSSIEDQNNYMEDTLEDYSGKLWDYDYLLNENERLNRELKYIEEECVVYECGTCIMCGESAPRDCRGMDDECICPDCVYKMLNDDDVWDAVIKY